MTDQATLDLYRPMVHFIAEMFGPTCEVLLHDISKPEASVIEIANGENSGRTIGSPLTAFARGIMENSAAYEKDNFWCNYSGAGKGKNFISSTFYIKNKGRLIGMLCVNRDMSEMQELNRFMARIAHSYRFAIPEENDVQESLDVPVSAIRENMVSNAISEYAVDPDRLSREEKIQLVHRLRDQGLLGMKGAVAEIARQLHVSEPTVYRYMNRSDE